MCAFNFSLYENYINKPVLRNNLNIKSHTKHYLMLPCSDTVSFSGATKSKRLNTRLKVINAVEKTIKETDEHISVIGVGSWVTGKEYKNPLEVDTSVHEKTFKSGSDHDMELIVPHDFSEEKALNVWQEFCHKLRKNLKEEFTVYPPSKIKKYSLKEAIDIVIDSVNVYPPSILMKYETIQDPNLGKKHIEYLPKDAGIAYFRDYATKSGIIFSKSTNSDGAIKKYKPKNIDKLYSHLKDLGFKEDELELTPAYKIEIADNFLTRANNIFDQDAVDIREATKLIKRAFEILKSLNVEKH